MASRIPRLLPLHRASRPTLPIAQCLVPSSRSISLWSSKAAPPAIELPTEQLPVPFETLSPDPALPTLLEPFSELFLTLPASLPFELTFLPLIPLLTLLLRTTTTLPSTIWQRKRTRKFEEEVMPIIKQKQKELEWNLRREGRENGKSFEWYKKEFNKRVKTTSTQIAKEHGCSPLPTMLLPPLIHIPIFITTTLLLRDACRLSLSSLSSPTASAFSATATATATDATNHLQDLALTPFLQITSLALPDPTMTLPLAVGLAVLLNVEVGAKSRATLQRARRALQGSLPSDPTKPTSRGGTGAGGARVGVMTPSAAELRRIVAKRARRGFSTTTITMMNSSMTWERFTTKELASREVSKALAAKEAQKTPEERELEEAEEEREREPLTAKVMTNLLRFSSIIFIPIAAMAPTAVCIYWLTSNMFTLSQNVILNAIDKRRLERALELRSQVVEVKR